MVARLNDSPLLHDMNNVRMHGRSEAVSDDNCSAPSCQFAESFEPVTFRPGIKGAGWFIKDDYRGVTEESAGKRNSLPLADTKFGASRKPVAKHAFRVLRQPGYYFFSTGCLHCGLDRTSLRCMPQIAVLNVFPN